MYRHTFMIILIVGLLCGCATKKPESPLAPSPQALKWQCNAKADEAMKNGDIQLGLREHARFVAEHPDNPLAHYHLGYAFGQIGNIQQEIAHYNMAVSLGYTHNEQLFFNLAMAYSQLREFDQAVKTFEKALELVPDDTDTLIELCRVYQEQGEIKKEHRILEQLLELEPNDDAVKQRLDELDQE